MLVVGLGLLGVGVYYFVLRAGMAPGADIRPVLEALVALSFGASLIAKGAVGVHEPIPEFPIPRCFASVL